jgi:hypothetical protein
MSEPQQGMESEARRDVGEGACERLIRFVDAVAPGDAVLMRFADPAVRYAVWADGAGDEAGHEALELRVLPPGEEAQLGAAEWAGAEGAPPVCVKHRGIEVWWRPGRAALQCDAEQAEALLPGLVEFAHYEGELRRLEEEIAGAWGELDEDRGLAFDVTAKELRRDDVVGERMARTLRRRMRLARLEAHLGSPDAALAAGAQRLGEGLRERARTEARAEIVDGQIEVFEHIYEMSAQRMGEYRASRQGAMIEWVIVALLGAEALLMLMQVLRGGR